MKTCLCHVAFPKLARCLELWIENTKFENKQKKKPQQTNKETNQNTKPKPQFLLFLGLFFFKFYDFNVGDTPKVRANINIL